jgi:hypothetical protein
MINYLNFLDKAALKRTSCLVCRLDRINAPSDSTDWAQEDKFLVSEEIQEITSSSSINLYRLTRIFCFCGATEQTAPRPPRCEIYNSHTDGKSP